MSKKWSDKEDSKLIDEIKRKVDIQEIATAHNRSVNALNIRMTKIFTTQVINNELDKDFSNAISHYTVKRQRKPYEYKEASEAFTEKVISLNKKVERLELVLDMILDKMLENDENRGFLVENEKEKENEEEEK